MLFQIGSFFNRQSHFITLTLTDRAWFAFKRSITPGTIFCFVQAHTYKLKLAPAIKLNRLELYPGISKYCLLVIFLRSTKPFNFLQNLYSP